MGLGGLEPPTSSLSGIIGNALRAATHVGRPVGLSGGVCAATSRAPAGAGALLPFCLGFEVNAEVGAKIVQVVRPDLDGSSRGAVAGGQDLVVGPPAREA